MFIYSRGKTGKQVGRGGEENMRVERLKDDWILLMLLRRPCASNIISKRKSTLRRRTREGAADILTKNLDFPGVMFCSLDHVIGTESCSAG